MMIHMSRQFRVIVTREDFAKVTIDSVSEETRTRLKGVEGKT